MLERFGIMTDTQAIDVVVSDLILRVNVLMFAVLSAALLIIK